MQAYLVAAGILTVAAACDYFTKKIPNLLIVSGYVIALATMLILDGFNNYYIYFIRALWPIPALFIFYYIKALGAGDIKLFSVISIFCPTQFFIRFILYSLVISALLGVVKLIIKKELHIKMLGLISHILACVRTREVTRYVPEGESSFISFGVCMLLGYLMSIVTEVLL